ncbi:hypothetical protein [Pectobacterium carotovorum]|uniref:hypothetical protein n=1 Tax=Pectobacterium carotovorum TaxID=554 RepID=UPI00301AF30F
MKQRELANEYREYVFIRSQLEDCLGFSLVSGIDILPDYLKPYTTRVGIQLTEAANILAGFKPKDIINKIPGSDVVSGYKDSLWDAVDNGILSGTNELTDYDFNQEYRVDITLIKDEVTLWAKKHGFNWPFNIPQFHEGECELEGNSESIIKQLEAENEALRSELLDAKSKIPTFLGTLRSDDPLLIAIKIRNQEWANYDPDNRRTIPSQEGIVAQLIKEYEEFEMKDAQAKAIEKVACPIKRK